MIHNTYWHSLSTTRHLTTNAQVRNTTAIFIINLSVSDLLFCCFNLPLAASKFLTRHWIWGPQLCRLYPLLRYGLLGVSIFNILAITINRYVMIAHPYIYNRSALSVLECSLMMASHFEMAHFTL